MKSSRMSLKRCLEKFDTCRTLFNELELMGEVKKVSASGEKGKEEEIKIQLAEQMAFELSDRRREGESRWGTYFGPAIVGPTEDGGWIERPSIVKISKEMISYWEIRAVESSHPILKCRYSDLVWDFKYRITNSKPDIKMARNVIDSIIDIVRMTDCPRNSWTIRKIKRGISLSIGIRDNSRLGLLVDSVLVLREMEGAGDYLYFTLFCLEVIVENKKISIDKEKEERLITDVERRIDECERGGNIEDINPFDVKEAALSLAKYYQKRGLLEDVARVLRAYGNTFLEASKTVDYLLAASWLKEVYEIYWKNGMREDAKSISERLKTCAEKSTAEMKSFSYEAEISKSEIEEYVEKMTAGSLDLVLARIAWRYVPMKDNIENLVRDVALTSPIQSLVSMSLQDNDGRVVGVVGSVDDDLQGRVVYQMSQNISLSSAFLRTVIEKAVDIFKINTDKIIDHIYRSPLFEESQEDILKSGIEAYFKGNHIAACHILIPQIERSIRNIIMKMGGDIYRPNANTGGLNLRTLDDVLRDRLVERTLKEDNCLYFRVVLTDQRGLNIRNNICHGLLSSDMFGNKISDRVFHLLLILAQVRDRSSVRSHIGGKYL